jgi:hypothetical protein
MKLLALAVLLSIMQASPPVPRKATDADASKSQPVQSDASADKKPSNKTPPIAQAAHPPPNQNTNPDNGANDAEKNIRVRELPPVSVTPDWMDCLALSFSAILLVVGIAGVVAAYRTLRAIEGQAGIMGGQLTKMELQLVEMQKQNTITVQERRSHLRIELESVLRLSTDILASPIKYEVKHYGPTDAFISESFIKMYVTDSKSPSTEVVFGRPLALLPKVMSPGSTAFEPNEHFLHHFTADEISRIEQGQSFVHLVGFIKYRDVYKDDHWARFNRVWEISKLAISRKFGTGGYWADCGEKQDNEQD